MNNSISRQAAIEAINGIINRFEQILRDIRESKVDDSVCGMCEYDGAFVGQSGDWCNECPGFEKADCFRLSDECRKRWLESVELPFVHPGCDEWCTDCKEYDQQKHYCPRWNRVIRQTVEELEKEPPEIIRCRNCKHWKDSDGVYRRGIGAESKCPLNIQEVYAGTFYCGYAERRDE